MVLGSGAVDVVEDLRAGAPRAGVSGRAVPIGWTVLAHPRRSVADDVDKAVREQVAARLACRGPVVCTAERGVADTPRMAHRPALGWHGRMRLNGSVGS